jgi:hypothetical protein
MKKNDSGACEAELRKCNALTYAGVLVFVLLRDNEVACQRDPVTGRERRETAPARSQWIERS